MTKEEFSCFYLPIQYTNILFFNDFKSFNYCSYDFNLFFSILLIHYFLSQYITINSFKGLDLFILNNNYKIFFINFKK